MAKGDVYLRADFAVQAELADEAAGILVACGALGCAVAAPFSPTSRRPAIIKLQAFFGPDAAHSVTLAQRILSDAEMMIKPGAKTRLVKLKDPGWATRWQSRFRQFSVGRRLAIRAPWERLAPPRGRTVITIEPGQAFGTGQHATTSSVLRAIETAASVRPGPRRALDVGTGSGILALAMRRLGIQEVSAIDNDEKVLDNARRNLKLNRIDGIELSARPLTSVRGQYDLVTANIITSVLIELAPALIKRLAAGGRLILSGILARETPMVLEHFRPPLRLNRIVRLRGWTTLVLARPQQPKK